MRRPLSRLLLAAVAAVPLYGYVVHASRDDQAVALVIILCWGLTCAAAVGMGVLAVVRSPESPRRRRAVRVTSAGLLVLAVVGWGGVRRAFYELLAG